ncbi:hypothetical protein HMPREF1145_1497 [Oribacterium parvum ACB8]|nr:hypothetical protein HMPREF1145_1497 [Oribacterium parvum ACB8]
MLSNRSSRLYRSFFSCFSSSIFCRGNILKYYLMYVYRYYFLIYKAVLSYRMIIFEGTKA